MDLRDHFFPCATTCALLNQRFRSNVIPSWHASALPGDASMREEDEDAASVTVFIVSQEHMRGKKFLKSIRGGKKFLKSIDVQALK
eukprot:6299915-Amphidinium_carterae.2